MKIGLTSIFVGYQKMKKLIIISLGVILLISLCGFRTTQYTGEERLCRRERPQYVLRSSR